MGNWCEEDEVSDDERRSGQIEAPDTDAFPPARRLSRRAALRLGALAVPALPALRSLPFLPVPVPGPVPTGPFVKPVPAEWFNVLGTNAEMRWDAAGDLGYLIPNERFFVRNHTATPVIDAAGWALKVFGSGLQGRPDADHAVTFSYRQLRRLPRRTVTAAIECAGNGRRFYGDQQGTPAAGTAWSLGGIGVARWTGVPLRAILERAGLTGAAVDVMPEGLDAPVVVNGRDDGHVRRPLPVDKALDDVLVAYEMNGEPLPPDHGFPARLVVPGWIGIASIKWLGRIEVADHRLTSPWNTTSYRLTGPDYPPDGPPITAQVPKSAFELPFGAAVQAGSAVTLTGRSWAGDGLSAGVEVSTDDGATWRRAHRHAPNLADAWVRWSLPWCPTEPGATALRARVTTAAGVSQPDVVPFNTGGYLFGAVVRHPVTVTA
jgi:DMSO/TMAO reductase YedYZ molybdopterin-dependent catalytic subunit